MFRKRHKRGLFSKVRNAPVRRTRAGVPITDMTTKRQTRTAYNPRTGTFAGYGGAAAGACEADKDCGPLEICHEGQCKWFDEVPLATPTRPARRSEPGPIFNPFPGQTYDPFEQRSSEVKPVRLPGYWWNA